MNNCLHKLLAVLTVLTLLTGCCAALAEETDTNADMPENHIVTGVSYPFLLQLSDKAGAPTESTMNLYFVDDGDIPYAALSEYTQFLSSLLALRDKKGITYEIGSDGEDELHHYTATRPDNSSTLYAFPEKDLILFSNYNTYTQSEGAKIMVSAMDLPEAGTLSPIDQAVNAAAAEESEDNRQETSEPESGEAETPVEETAASSLFVLKQGMYLNRAGNEIRLNLADYGTNVGDGPFVFFLTPIFVLPVIFFRSETSAAFFLLNPFLFSSGIHFP